MKQPTLKTAEKRRALERALAAFHEASFGWALACCARNRDEAEEVLQTSYLKALDGRARFNGHSELRTWFFGVVRTTAQERRRFRLLRRNALDLWLGRRPRSGEAATPESLSGRAEARVRLRTCLEGLSRRQRDLLHLVFYQELTVEQAAAVLGVSVGTARTHYERGKTRLRARLAESEEDDEPSQRSRGTDSTAVCGRA